MRRGREAKIIDYSEPKTVDEAVALLVADEESLCLAGGATLVAMMNFGVMQPSALVSLRRIEELRGIHLDEQGGLRIGAMTSHREVATDERLVGSNNVVREAAASIDVAIRNMGTIGGAVSHADPASDLNTALVSAGALVEIAGPKGRRTVPIDEFFVFYLTTVLEPNELVTAVRLPGAPKGSVGAFDKVCRVHGDTPTLSAA
ncbi:MAG: FAD binding domain-containing protein [Pseudomonadota bacterium]|nr:FAD binding domain-containing protein [Pseudomonadota bacterium]